MRFPLNQMIPIGYSFGEKTFYSASHKGQDYRANYWNLYAPTDCTTTSFYDAGGGKWINFSFGNTVIQCAHLSKYVKLGVVKKGELVAVTGNSGIYTSGPHLHLQIRVGGKLVDPMKFDWSGSMSQCEVDLKTTQAQRDEWYKKSVHYEDLWRKTEAQRDEWYEMYQQLLASKPSEESFVRAFFDKLLSLIYRKN